LYKISNMSGKLDENKSFVSIQTQHILSWKRIHCIIYTYLSRVSYVLPALPASSVFLAASGTRPASHLGPVHTWDLCKELGGGGEPTTILQVH